MKNLFQDRKRVRNLLLAILGVLVLCCCGLLAIPTPKNDDTASEVADRATNVEEVEESTDSDASQEESGNAEEETDDTSETGEIVAEGADEPIEASTSTPKPTSTNELTEEPTETSEPTDEPTVQPQVVVNVSSANIRSGPGANYERVDSVLEGEVLVVIATNSSGDWYNVELSNGDLAWVAASVVDAADDISDLVVIAATIPSPPTTAPTAVSTQAPVATNTPAPTSPPVPTVTAAPSAAQVRIINVNKRDEYVDIQNTGGTDQDLSGWVLVSERGNQTCGLGGNLAAGQTLRIYALAEDSSKGGFNCGFGGPIWNNSESDPAALYDNNGNLVDRR